jgi:enediyne biosynthesis protein E4
MFFLWLVACIPKETSVAPAETDSDPVEAQRLYLSDEVVCVDPSLREEATFDLLKGAGQVVPAELYGGGVAVADFDGDGQLDVLLPNVALYWGADGEFVEGEHPDVDLTLAAGATPADVDGDGDFDVYVARQGAPDVLLRNDDGVFVDGTAYAQLGEFADHAQTASFADFDYDGDLDIFVATHGEYPEEGRIKDFGPGDDNRLFTNDGTGIFTDVTHMLPEAARIGYGFVGGWQDMDLDGRVDLYVVHDFGNAYPSQLVYNRPDGFVLDGGMSGLNLPYANMGLGIGDLDDDDYPDLVVPCWKRTSVMISETFDEDVAWFDYSANLGMTYGDDRKVAWAGELADMDLDMDLDAWVVLGWLDTRWDNTLKQADALWIQDADGHFEDHGAAWGVDDVSVGRGLVIADLNRDGWPDAVRPNLVGKARMHMSRCGTAAWLRVSVDQPGANVHGIGAEVIVYAGETRQRRWIRAGGTSVNAGGPPEVLFGLADHEVVDLEIRWPDGAKERFAEVPTRRAAHISR